MACRVLLLGGGFSASLPAHTGGWSWWLVFAALADSCSFSSRPLFRFADSVFCQLWSPSCEFFFIRVVSVLSTWFFYNFSSLCGYLLGKALPYFPFVPLHVVSFRSSSMFIVFV